MNKISTPLKPTFILTKFGLIIALLTLVAWGCEDDNQVIHNDQAKENNDSQPSPNPDADLSTGEADETGHGPDKDVEQLPPGLMNGGWRVADVEDDSLVVTLDLVHAGHETIVEGYYSMSSIAINGADSAGGDIMNDSSFDGETLTVNWNPTPIEDEVYTLEATMQDQNTFSGTLNAEIHAEPSKDIQITRITPPPSDGGGDGDTPPDADAGPQGGAGDESAGGGGNE